MNEATLQWIEELMDKVNQLLLVRETVPAPITVPEPEGEFITTRAPASELKIYPMLKDALTSIEEDFFRIQLTIDCGEEDQFHATWNPGRLAQATRPVDYYFYRIIQDNPGIRSDDPRFLFANTMRVLLSDIAAAVTQWRLDNLHRGMDLPGKPQQLVESEVKPLMGQDKLDALIAQKHQKEGPGYVSPFAGANSTVLRTVPAAILLQRKPRKLLFRPTITRNNQLFAGEDAAAEGGLIRDPNRPPCRGPPRNVQTNMEEAHGQPMGPEHLQSRLCGRRPHKRLCTTKRLARFDGEDVEDVSPPDSDGGSGIIAYKESNQRSQTTRFRLLQPTVCHSKEDRGTQACSRLTETEHALQRLKL
ncbi:hypothetical protein BB561_000339 [Smittium simulii]|uniref:Uncharacterized protein n=1 Tax=Smittium simulii TaxID=133385 RepID=A0A2T9YZI9_9FUNG|nr:hypothetical protein BB561_000339 [Smittium simulii]